MMEAGAKGETAEQIREVLHTALPEPVLHSAFNRLALDLAARNIAPHSTTEDNMVGVSIRLADSLWVQDNLAIEPAYLATLGQNYDSGVWLVDFDQSGLARQTINQWVSDATEGRITDLLGSGDVTPATQLILVNALYFAANWYPMAFDQALTSPATFRTLSGQDVTASMMHRDAHYPYAAGTDWEMLELPYDGQQLSMIVVLPTEGAFSSVRDGLSAAWLEQALSALESREVRVTFPKFSFTWGSAPLTSTLMALGLTDVFDSERADFSGISSTNPVPTGGIVHQAFVGVDESGTVAAAATAWPTVGAVMSPVDFIVDRPFLFFIRDETGIVLFGGQVLDPTA
jgi:serpin B